MKSFTAFVAFLLLSVILAQPPACVPTNDPPKQDDLWDLRYYYNWGRILHAFAANDEGYDKIQSNGIGYDSWNGAGSLGATISDDGFAKLAEVCGDAAQRANIKKMWFTKTGQSFQHVFASTNPEDIYVGYVSTKADACGAKWPVKRWSCLVSPDMMYAGNLAKNAWYAGRQQNGGKVHFWLWEFDETTRDEQRKGC